MSKLKVSPDVIDYFRRNGPSATFRYNGNNCNSRFISAAQYVINHKWIAIASGREFNWPAMDDTFFIGADRILYVKIAEEGITEAVNPGQWCDDDFAQFIAYLQDEMELTPGVDFAIPNWKPQTLQP